MSLLRALARDAYRGVAEHALGGYVRWSLASGQGVALTFDDGPDPALTPRILDTLAEYGVHATFFVVGEQVDRFPHLVRRIVDEGHQLGNHTYTHFHCPELDLDGLMRQIDRADAAIAAAVGENDGPYVFRPPFGELRPRQAVYLALEGRRVALWTRDSLDYRNATADAIAAMGATLRHGDVVLMHDRFPNTLEALPTLLETLRRRGLQTVRPDDAPSSSTRTAAPARRRAGAF